MGQEVKEPGRTEQLLGLEGTKQQGMAKLEDVREGTEQRYNPICWGDSGAFWDILDKYHAPEIGIQRRHAASTF